MTKFLKAVSISGVAAIALSLGAVNVIGSATDDDNVGIAYLPYNAEVVNVTPEMIAENYRYNEVYEKAFEEAYKEEWDNYDIKAWEDGTAAALKEWSGDTEALKNDPYMQIKDPSLIIQDNAEKRAREVCEKQDLTHIALTEYEANHWIGRFGITGSIEGTTIPFTDPHKFNLTVSGRSATMNGKNGYSSNYKRVIVRLTYSNGKTTEQTLESSSSSGLTVTAPAVAGAYITNASYDFYLYDNAEVAKGLLERAIVYINRT